LPSRSTAGSFVGSKPAQQRKRKPNPATAVKRLTKAGVEVKAVTLLPDGGVTLALGERAGAAETTNGQKNPWDEVLPHEPH
jgi:hypothetical protein